jgi:hypothetical protein
MRIEMTDDELKDYYAREEDEMLIRSFVASVGYDYVEHDHKNVPQINPDFSRETKIMWEEIESRLKGSTVLNFDRDKCISLIKEEAKNQEDLIKKHGPNYTTSYHVGLKNAHWDDIRIIEKCITKENNHE